MVVVIVFFAFAMVGRGNSERRTEVADVGRKTDVAEARGVEGGVRIGIDVTVDGVHSAQVEEETRDEDRGRAGIQGIISILKSEICYGEKLTRQRGRVWHRISAQKCQLSTLLVAKIPRPTCALIAMRLITFKVNRNLSAAIRRLSQCNQTVRPLTGNTMSHRAVT